MIAGSALAQDSVPSVRYPIADLGGCKDQSDCKAFCNQPENMIACVSFGEKQGMLTGEELRISKIVAQKVSAKETPGGCTTQTSCEAYCQGNVDHLSSCVSFGESLGVIPEKDLAEAKNIMKALENGAKMPGQCKTKNDCQNYCATGSHIDECLSFAEAAGILAPEDLAQAKKVAPFLKNGETPGKCQTKADCDAYCANDANFGECVGFAEKAGMISSEEAAMAKKVGGKGPGGCKGAAECATYCDQGAHADECLNFAKDKGLLTAEQQAEVTGGIEKLKQGLDQIPAEVKGGVTSCLENAIGKDKFAQVMNGQATLTKEQGDSIQGCFANISELMQEKMMKKGAQGAPAGFSGDAGGGTPPSKEDIMKNLPDNIPADVRENIQKQINSQTPSSIPSGENTVLPQGHGTNASGGPYDSMTSPSSSPVPPSGTMPSVDCSAFASAPSCDYIPAGTPRDMCVKCKSAN